MRYVTLVDVLTLMFNTHLQHRDLHWGQILVKDVPSKGFDRGSARAPGGQLPMDHPTHGVKATVIDLGLARMDACGDNGSIEIYWTPFDEEIFEGEGQRVAFELLHPPLI